MRGGVVYGGGGEGGFVGVAIVILFSLVSMELVLALYVPLSITT